MKFFLFSGIVTLLWFVAGFSSGYVGDAAHYALRPFLAVWGYGYESFLGVRGFFVSRESLRRDVGRLNEDNTSLRQTIGELETLKTENEGLRQALGNKEFAPSVAHIFARIIGKGAHIFGQTLLIDCGSLAGVREGAVVIAGSRMLVGRVSRVTPHHAEVLLPGNRSFRAAAKIIFIEPESGGEDSRNQVLGERKNFIDALVRGEGLGSALLDMLPADAMLNGGETILTSGFDGTFPPDLVVGKAGRLVSDSSDFFQRAEIELAVDIGVLKTVAVLNMQEPFPDLSGISE